MKRLLLALFVVALLSGCGDSDDADPGSAEAAVVSAPAADDADTTTEAATTGDDAITPEGNGEPEMNTIRIGSQVWTRTLPMTTGQCWVTDENDGGSGLPASSNIWGTLDGDEDVRFSAGMDQDGAFGAEVDDQRSFYWVSGKRSPLNELTITHDYENRIARGTGVFENALTGERAYGSFAFQCQADEG